MSQNIQQLWSPMESGLKYILLRPNKNNKCVSGKGSENLGRYSYFFLKRN